MSFTQQEAYLDSEHHHYELLACGSPDLEEILNRYWSDDIDTWEEFKFIFNKAYETQNREEFYAV